MAGERVVRVEAQGPSAGPGAGAPLPEPGPLAPEDVVPRFRSDLRVARGSSAAFFDVTDAGSGRTFTVYEFELAIARLLDGRRTVAQVIESAGRLAIPVDARTLHRFVRQMWQYGLLAPPGAPARAGDAAATWSAREPWDEETRARYQSAQRLVRLGRNAEAAGHLQAILGAHPGNAEARELLALVERGHSLAIGRTLDRAADAWPVPPSPRPGHRHPAVVAGALVALAVLALVAIALLVPPGVPDRAPPGPPPAAASAPPVPPSPSAPSAPSPAREGRTR